MDEPKTDLEATAFKDEKSREDYQKYLALTPDVRSSGVVEVGHAQRIAGQWNPPCGTTCNCVEIGTSLPPGAKIFRIDYFHRTRGGIIKQNNPDVDLEWAMVLSAQSRTAPDGRVFVSSTFKNWSHVETRAGKIDVYYTL